MPFEVNGEVPCHDIYAYSARCLPGAVNVVVDYMSPYSKKA